LPRRVLLDECVPRQLKEDLHAFATRTVPEMGWSGIKNGALVELARGHFDVIFTVDWDFAADWRGQLAIAIVILEATTTDPTVLRPHMPSVIRAIETAAIGQVPRVGGYPAHAADRRCLAQLPRPAPLRRGAGERTFAWAVALPGCRRCSCVSQHPCCHCHPDARSSNPRHYWRLGRGEDDNAPRP
jgi:hypothetical protein